MDIKTLLKLSLLGLLALSFTAPMAYADENGMNAKVATAREKRAEDKVPPQNRIVLALGKLENRSNAADCVLEMVRARLLQSFAAVRAFEVVDRREQLKEMLREQALMASGVTEGKNDGMPKVGKIKAAAYIIYGNVLECAVDKSHGNAEGVTVVLSKSRIELQIKIANTETGDLLMVKTVTGYGIDRTMATSDFRSTTGNGMRDAIEEACQMAADALRDLIYPAKIVGVGKRDVTINMTDGEVKEGDVFCVREVTPLGTDKDTGEFLGYGDREIGRVVITYAGQQVSRAEPVAKAGEDIKLSLDELDADRNRYLLRRIGREALKREARRFGRLGPK